MKHINAGILTMGLMLTACASHEPKPPKTEEFFNTLIKKDGTKQFSYAMVMAMPVGEGSGEHHKGERSGHHSRGHHDGDGHHSQPDKGGAEKEMDDHLGYLFTEGLIAKLEDTGFCRQGYKELTKSTRMGAMQISGECNDSASDDDKVKFPNPPPKKIKEEVIE